jgi:flagellar biosynthetic protein FlhB
MRMSYQEMQEELKESEGSPEVRARLRQRQRQLATSRMMSSIEKADVILVNPEHYAVALRYDQSKMLAPVVVAKGTDELALKIQQIAREFSVPIARIPPLARLMHQRMRVGEAVPAALFEAVAKVLAWAYEIRDHGKEPALPDVGALPTLEQLAKKPAGT